MVLITSLADFNDKITAFKMARNIIIALMVLLVLFVIMCTIILYVYLHNKFCDYHGYSSIDEGVLDS